MLVLRSFLWLDDNPLFGFTNFDYSPIDVYLGHFHFLAIMNNAVRNIWVQVFVWACFSSFGHVPRIKLLGHLVTLSITC